MESKCSIELGMTLSGNVIVTGLTKSGRLDKDDSGLVTHQDKEV